MVQASLPLGQWRHARQVAEEAAVIALDPLQNVERNEKSTSASTRLVANSDWRFGIKVIEEIIPLLVARSTTEECPSCSRENRRIGSGEGRTDHPYTRPASDQGQATAFSKLERCST